MDEPVAPGPAGRRANGLPAHDWGALVDLDPRLSEGLLDRLAGAGVAAYVEPATAVDTVSRAVVMPARPLDRLWVDATRADAAREVVASEVADLTALLSEDEPGATAHGLVLPVPRTAARRVLPPPALPDPPRAPRPAPEPPDGAHPDHPDPPDHPGEPAAPTPGADEPSGPAGKRSEPPSAPRPLDDDAVFAQIVAGFARDLPQDGERPWPEAEDLPPEGRRRRGDDPSAPPPARGDLPGAPPRGSRALPPRPLPPGPLPPRALPPRALPPRALPPRPLPPEEPGPTGPTPAWEPPGLDDGHYVPPPPPPVPRIRLRTLAALLSVLLGLVVLFAPHLVGLSTRDLAVGVLGLALLAGGAGALVWWMRDSASDSGPDDGAVV